MQRVSKGKARLSSAVQAVNTVDGIVKELLENSIDAGATKISKCQKISISNKVSKEARILSFAEATDHLRGSLSFI